MFTDMSLRRSTSLVHCLSDMMFVTKRGLSEACNVVGSQLDQVSDTLIVTYFCFHLCCIKSYRLYYSTKNVVLLFLCFSQYTIVSGYHCSGYKETSSWED
jgi:hypothetical protein